MARKRQPFLTIDAETDPFHNCNDLECEKCHGGGRLPIPFLWGVYNGATGQYWQFETINELSKFLERLEADEGGCLFYAHNGGKFDYHFIREEINSDESILVISGRLAKFRIGNHEFRDSLNIFPNTRLKDFGIKSEIEYSKMEASVRHLHMAEIGAYLKQDCVGLWEVISRYRKDYGKQLTQAGASMKVWQKMSGLDAPRQTKSQYEYLKPFYYGGRVQCFTPGIKQCDFEVYDINSAYPFAMLSKHPFSTTYIEDSRLPTKTADIGPCLIKLRCKSHGGALPFKQETQLYFPDDGILREYTITGWEYLAATELKTLSEIEIISCYKFSHCVDFKQYIEHFFAQREECRKKGDVAGRTFGKYFMNSLYGKFGANCANYSEYVIASDESQAGWEEKGYHVFKPWGTRFLMVRNPTEDELDDIQGKWRYYNIATAASVTGFVRAYLYRALHGATDVIYCDTDSIAARSFDSLPTGNELGKWKHEMTGDHYAVSGKKMYAFHEKGKPLEYFPDEEKEKNWKLASKGVDFGKLKDGPQRIINLCNGGREKYTPQAPTTSITREQAQFIPREIRYTAKDMSKVPLVEVPQFGDNPPVDYSLLNVAEQLHGRAKEGRDRRKVKRTNSRETKDSGTGGKAIA